MTKWLKIDQDNPRTGTAKASYELCSNCLSEGGCIVNVNCITFVLTNHTTYV